MALLFITLIISIGVITYYVNKNEKERSKKLRNVNITNQNKISEYLKSKEITESKKYISKDYSNAIILDERNNEILIITKKFKRKSDGTFEYSFNHYNFDRLIETELAIDNQIIHKSVRTNQLVGAAVGGAIFGSVGAIIGGLSGNKVEAQNIKSIELKISVEDIDYPIHKISFLSSENNKNGYSKDSNEVKVALKNIEKWYGILEIIINQQNK
ncbi:hypothetical protein KDN24_06120 [Bacillus sp. Bva_UNVM-123]|uniref:hypothetical protein n=1 Tax=Bacillus sp. Bva_UNVM-123 TaxID=2829798 RepID=UPI00391F874D